jgi:hypothetical protein
VSSALPSGAISRKRPWSEEKVSQGEIRTASPFVATPWPLRATPLTNPWPE